MKLTLIVLLTAALTTAHAETFKKTKLLVQDGGKSKEVSIALNVTDDGIEITRKNAEPIAFRFADVKGIEYERAQSPRTKTAIFISPLFLLSKSKKHWLHVESSDGAFAILRLDKKEQQMIRATVQAKWGHDVKVIIEGGK